jgi:hypothetical protein
MFLRAADGFGHPVLVAVPFLSQFNEQGSQTLFEHAFFLFPTSRRHSFHAPFCSLNDPKAPNCSFAPLASIDSILTTGCANHLSE